MISANIEQSTGKILTPIAQLTHAYEQKQFEEQFANEINLIHRNSVAHYTLRPPLLLFEEVFRLSLYFDHQGLESCVLQLMSGPAEEMNDYPSSVELQVEFDYLVELYSLHLTGKHTAEYPWKHGWKYAWGDITLLLQPQSSSVISDISWTA